MSSNRSFSNDNYQIAWRSSDIGIPDVKVGPHPDRIKDSWLDRGGWPLTSGCCYSLFMDMDEQEQANALLALAFQIVCDGVSPDKVLQEFAKIPVWRNMQMTLPSGVYERAFAPGHWELSPHNL